MQFASRRFHAVSSYWLNSSKYFYFKRINNIYKRIAAIKLTDSSGNENFKTAIPSNNYDRPKTTGECGMF